MSDDLIQVLGNVPDAARALIWEEFFRSRDRGLSLTVHSPWIDGGAELFCVTVREAGSEELVGTLVVKLHQHGDGRRIGMIGYVGVLPECRGRGMSRRMVDRAIDAAREHGLAALILWTQTPQVYRGNGFVPHGNDVFRQYATLPRDAAREATRVSAWPDAEDSSRGIPAFASAARRVSGSRASIIVLDTPGGAAIAEWTGDDADVVDLIADTVDGDWWLNAFAGDSLLACLESRGIAVLQDRPSGMMVCPLDGADPAAVAGIRLLDRI